MREFKNATELLALCSEKDLPISEIMRQREIIIGEMQVKGKNYTIKIYVIKVS